MRNSILTGLLFVSFLLIGNLSAQVADQVTLGQGYTEQSFYSLQDGEVSNLSNTDWDIAFLTEGFNSSILINDNLSTALYLYSNEVSDWTNVDTTGITWNNLRNSEVNWKKGAFTQIQNTANPFDYGWGQYAGPPTHIVSGNKIFILELGNGSFKKVIIESLDFGVYTFKYADLDGSNEVTETVNNADFANKNFWYYSIQNEEVIDREPATENWDITFTTYSSEVAPGFNYLVVGALQNLGVSASQASGVAVEEANWSDYPMAEEMNILGSDWKYFDMDNFVYVIEEDLSYFVQDIEGNVWQVVFTGFGGSATGSIEFTKELISVTGLDESSLIDFSVFPNPSNGRLDVILPIEMDQAYYTVVDAQGRAILSDTWTGGFQHTLDLYDVPSGIYLLQIEMNGAIGQETIVVR
jgi:hypothetical protein